MHVYVQVNTTKIGPFGGTGGNAWDIYSKTKKLVTVKIWSVDSSEGGVINGLAFTYVNDEGKNIPSGPWGAQTGDFHMVRALVHASEI